MNKEQLTSVIDKIAGLSPAFSEMVATAGEGFIESWSERFASVSVSVVETCLLKRFDEGLGQWGHRTILEDVLRDAKALAGEMHRRDESRRNIRQGQHAKGTLRQCQNVSCGRVFRWSGPGIACSAKCQDAMIASGYLQFDRLGRLVKQGSWERRVES